MEKTGSMINTDFTQVDQERFHINIDEYFCLNLFSGIYKVFKKGSLKILDITLHHKHFL